MAFDLSALPEFFCELKLTDITNRIRVATETLYQELIDAEATVSIGAGRFERSTHRNGSRPSVLTTTAGQLDLTIAKLLAGTAFPALLERRRRVDHRMLSQAIVGAVFQGPAWYRCRVHFVRRALDRPKRQPGHGRLDYPHTTRDRPSRR